MLEHAMSAPANPERVVILGARGFIGSALSKRLQDDGVPLLALTSSDLELTSADAADRLAALLGPSDAVVMLAALTPDRGRDIGTFRRNLEMAHNVCLALSRQPTAQLVYASSDAVYAPAHARITEDTCASPDDLYGTMHRAREVMFQSIQIPVAVLRYTLIFGAGDTHNSYGPNRFRRMACKEGRITLFGAGEETRDHVHVDDAARLTAEVLRHRSRGTLNVASGRSLSFDSVARIVAAHFEQSIEVVHTPRQSPVTHRHYDTIALSKAFPLFRFTSIEDGLARAHREVIESQAHSAGDSPAFT